EGSRGGCARILALCAAAARGGRAGGLLGDLAELDVLGSRHAGQRAIDVESGLIRGVGRDAHRRGDDAGVAVGVAVRHGAGVASTRALPSGRPSTALTTFTGTLTQLSLCGAPPYQEK